VAPGRKTGGRPLGSRNKKTLARLAEAQAIAAGTADGPKAIPTLTRIMRWHLDRADAELAKPSPDPAIISAAYTEARTTAIALAQFQAPKLSAVALGQVTKMTVVVKGGIPPRPLTQADADRIADQFGLPKLEKTIGA
jgi:hypothetical protein